MIVIDPGELRKLIVIQRIGNSKDNENIPSDDGWSTILSANAKILNVTGEEFLEAKGIGSKIAKTFYIRFPKNIKITNEDRILYEGIPYNILYVNNIEEKGIYLEIKTEFVD